MGPRHKKLRQFCREALKYRTFCCKNVVYGLWAKKNEKICTASRPSSLPRPAPYQVGSYFKAFPSYKTATWETQLDGKKRGAQLDSLGSKLFYMNEEAVPQATTIWGDLPNLEEDFGQNWGVILSYVQSPSSWLSTILGGNQLCLGRMTWWIV